MEISELGWLFGIHIAMAGWLGLLAARWKQRSAWRWFFTGLLTSVFGLVLLARLERLSAAAFIETDMQLQFMDSTSLRG